MTATIPTFAPSSPSRLRAAVLAVWSVGVVAYVVSIVNRTSLSALGIETADRFAITAATLSLLAVVQLGIYGALQLPVGLLLDRFGAGIVLTAGMAVMAAAQVLLAAAPDVGVAIAARLLMGAGEAAIFPGVLRVIGMRFPRRIAPTAVQVTGLLGQFGQIISVVPFAALVGLSGWTAAFLSLGGVTVLTAVLVAVIVRERRPAVVERTPVARAVREAWRSPGTRLAFWVHFVTSFSGNAFAILWGFPFLVAGQGLDAGTAGALFSVYVVGGIVLGPLVGAVSGRFPHARTALVVSLVAVQASSWAAVLAFPDRAPLPLLVVLALAMCAGGPASMVAFDIVRDHNPRERLSTASGVVNGAGFSSSILVILAIGAALTLQAGGAEYSPAAFRLAELVQVPFWTAGLLLVWRAQRAVRLSSAPEAP
ncbi:MULTISPECIES: nitrate/nitrite transporter [Microbacterium]|uniref:MFS transporter n=1 Tax=Microbacterium TaxID=33882 RepID=UPI0027853BCE|nr:MULTISPECIES: MFS transporter [Microbacterium]MDQ1082451.1 MFS family permease [Microbacterium sp. SORGH_AS_0344]MDQ1168777.1 MFS family permease [Microbacterium proteolyticum]